MKVPLSHIAHTRSGDKGDMVNIGVIAYDQAHYADLVREVTPERVKQHFGDLVQGEVLRYELPNLGALKGPMSDKDVAFEKSLATRLGNLNLSEPETRKALTEAQTFLRGKLGDGGGGDDSSSGWRDHGGGVRAALDSGTLTYGELFEVAPFGNMLVRLTMTGAGLRAWFEKAFGRRDPVALLSGVTVTYDTTKAAGSRVVSVVMNNGEPLVDAQTYRFVYSDFLNANGDGLQATEGVQRVEELGIVDIDALTEYVRRNSPVRAPRDNRTIIRTP